MCTQRWNFLKLYNLQLETQNNGKGWFNRTPSLIKWTTWKAAYVCIWLPFKDCLYGSWKGRCWIPPGSFQANILSHAIGEIQVSPTSVNCVRSPIIQNTFVGGVFGPNRKNAHLNVFHPNPEPTLKELREIYGTRTAIHHWAWLDGRPIQFTFQGIQQQIHLSEAIS